MDLLGELAYIGGGGCSCFGAKRIGDLGGGMNEGDGIGPSKDPGGSGARVDLDLIGFWAGGCDGGIRLE
jgi:hypothetical protein